MSFNYITDVLYRNHNFKLSVILFGDNSTKDNSKYKDKKIISALRNENSCKIFLNTFNKTFLSLETIPPNIVESKPVKGEKILFPQTCFNDLDQALSLCVEWLKSKQYKYLFNVDGSGNVKGLGTAPPYHPAVYKSASEYIRFAPAVVRSFDGNLYEGISLRSNKGVFTSFTCTDFFTLSSITRNFMFNSYNNTLQLLSLGVNISLKSKQ